MKYDWDGKTGEKPAKRLAIFPVIIAFTVFIIVAVYLLFVLIGNL